MLTLSTSFTNQSIFSLRTGGEVALAVDIIINPHNLKIEGFYCLDRFSNNQLILLTQDVRDFTPRGMIVDDHDVLTPPEELVRLKDILEIHFSLTGKQVITQSKRKLGKVSDYAIDNDSMFVHKIYISQSILKSFSGGQLSIDRTQIVEITNQKIVVADTFEKQKARGRGRVAASMPAAS